MDGSSTVGVNISQ